MKYLLIGGLVALGIYFYTQQDKRAWLVNYFKTHNLPIVASLVQRMTDSEVNFLYESIQRYSGSTTSVIPPEVSNGLDSIANTYGFSWS